MDAATKIRLVLGIIIVFCVSTFMSCQELRFKMFGKTTDGRIVDDRIVDDMDRHGIAKKRVVDFSFMDGDIYRRHGVDVPLDWQGRGGSTVTIEYIPGKEFDSRILGQKNTFWVVIFVVSLVAAGFGIFWLSRDTNLMSN